MRARTPTADSCGACCNRAVTPTVMTVSPRLRRRLVLASLRPRCCKCHQSLAARRHAALRRSFTGVAAGAAVYDRAYIAEFNGSLAPRTRARRRRSQEHCVRLSSVSSARCGHFGVVDARARKPVDSLFLLRRQTARDQRQCSTRACRARGSTSTSRGSIALHSLSRSSESSCHVWRRARCRRLKRVSWTTTHANDSSRICAEKARCREMRRSSERRHLE